MNTARAPPHSGPPHLRVTQQRRPVMDITQLYPSRYLSAGDLQGQPVRATIEALTQEMVGQGADAKLKPVLRLAGQAKLLVLNKTNGLAIAAQYGNDTAGWIGKAIVLKPTTVPFQGKLVAAVRVDAFTPSRPATPSPEPRRSMAAALPAPE